MNVSVLDGLVLRNLRLTRDTHLMQQFIYYYKQLYMFRASICPSLGVLGCILIILLHMVSSTIKENCALVGCRNVLYVYIAGIRGGGVCLGRCMGVRVCVAGEWV